MSMPVLYCILGSLLVSAIYFTWGRNKGPSAAAGDTKGK
jgi:hypothetical protein